MNVQAELDMLKEEVVLFKKAKHNFSTIISLIALIGHFIAMPYWNYLPFEPTTAWTLICVALMVLFVYNWVQLLEETNWISFN